MPDLPSQIATGGNKIKVVCNIKQANSFHVEFMQHSGLTTPIPVTEFKLMEMA